MDTRKPKESLVSWRSFKEINRISEEEQRITGILNLWMKGNGRSRYFTFIFCTPRGYTSRLRDFQTKRPPITSRCVIAARQRRSHLSSAAGERGLLNFRDRLSVGRDELQLGGRRPGTSPSSAPCSEHSAHCLSPSRRE
ncbi:hypothetical protein EVAR_63867_1 [Eumeta japonica]|uniref:Uncharacterized protein n=1 Tax=Eumeta variegata TaxID=151549 RepID=A0A4C2A5A0_EUMVA|nr:hypothetical protein EVAR_63867_1 [Eumeta japonica]